MQTSLPIIDLSYVSQKYSSSDEWVSFDENERTKTLVNELCQAFKTWGFLYIKGHGIDKKIIADAFKTAQGFFDRSVLQKEDFRRGSGISLGYVPPTGEIFEEAGPADIKEAFDYLPNSQLTEQLSQQLPEMVAAQNKLFAECHMLVLNLLRLLAMALEIDTEHFVNMHSALGDRNKNGSSMRLLYYPIVENKIFEKQMRCSPHTDYGTMTLLFQDMVGGLEVLSPAGTYLPVKPIPETIIINGGDLLQMWSNNAFKATLHKVTLPITTCRSTRQSIAFFVHPDYDVNIDYKSDGGMVRQQNAQSHLKERFDATIYSNFKKL